jgi:hypothetical protein
MAWPVVLEPGVVSDCASEVLAPYKKTTASKKVRLGAQLSLKKASFASNSRGDSAEGDNILVRPAILGNRQLPSVRGMP